MIRKTPTHGDTPPPRRPVRRDIRWDKLDNTAHLFPVIAGEQMSNVYRISVTLTELIDPALLQQALDMVLPKFHGFDLRIRRGVFWHYFEENGKPAPRVGEENQFPCRYIRPHRNNSYLFRVTYYKYRINLEIFHVLTDGMGGLNFLKELTYQYLRLAHPELMDEGGHGLSLGTTLNREDSFLRNYKKLAKRPYQSRWAYQVRGEKLAPGEFGVMHGYLELPALKGVCRAYGCSINDYLLACYMWSVYTECLHKAPSKDPVRVAVPVNLRPYFDSVTTKNFFVMVMAQFHPTREDHTFEEVLASVTESLRDQLTPEHLERVFSYNVSRQKNPLLKAVPLPVKGLFMRLVYNRSARATTTTITNVGQIRVEERYQPYIEMFHAFLAISRGQHLKGTICSYGDTLVFTFSYDLMDPGVQRGFFRKLAADGLRVQLESNGVNYG